VISEATSVEVLFVPMRRWGATVFDGHRKCTQVRGGIFIAFPSLPFSSPHHILKGEVSVVNELAVLPLISKKIYRNDKRRKK
jgi:hypothetical protein